jgi:hypothetical protein
MEEAWAASFVAESPLWACNGLCPKLLKAKVRNRSMAVAAPAKLVSHHRNVVVWEFVQTR